MFDQTLNFICLENNLFTLNQDKAFQKLNSAKTRDVDIETIVDATTSALHSVLNTLDIIPIIKCMKSNAAEMVARKLNAKLKDHIANSSVSANTGNTTRPIVIIVDRIIDLQTMISHNWTDRKSVV